MTSGDLLDLFRDEMDDATAPYLWSDELVFTYINDAQSMFCRLTDGIADATNPAVTQIAVVPGTEWYATHPSIKLLRTATRADNGRDVSVVNLQDMPTRGMYFDGRPGPVNALVLGAEEDKARIWPMPNETITINLVVFREPLLPITDDQALEIPSKNHLALLKWVKHLAYTKQNAETFDRTRAKEFKDAFELYCSDVQTEQRRKRHKPRAVVYGGI